MADPQLRRSARAWIKPLKNGTWQYFARVNGHERIMGAAYNAEAAHDTICDYIYPRCEDLDWDIEWKTSA